MSHTVCRVKARGSRQEYIAFLSVLGIRLGDLFMPSSLTLSAMLGGEEVSTREETVAARVLTARKSPLPPVQAQNRKPHGK